MQEKKLISIKTKIKELLIEKQYKKNNIKIIAISKTFSMINIMPLIESGHIHYGENKIQEAENKWFEVKKKFSNIKLHMVGKLQTNKAKKAVQIFDFIHSVDNFKLAEKIDKFKKELDKKIDIFIQVNLGDEIQKSGIKINELNDFYNFCTKKLSLNVIGLMCIPPQTDHSIEYFKKLEELSKNLGLQELSMGMSNDYLDAIKAGATYVRLGSSIFGNRKS